MHSCIVDVNSEIVFNQKIEEKLKNCSYKNMEEESKEGKIPKNIGIYEGEELICGVTGYFSSGWYYLKQLWVKQSHRNLGYGKWLLAQIEQIARQKKVQGVRLELEDATLHSYYESLGYFLLKQPNNYNEISEKHCLEKIF